MRERQKKGNNRKKRKGKARGRSCRKNPLTSKFDTDFPASSRIGGISGASCSALPDRKMPRPEQLYLILKFGMYFRVKTEERI